MKAKCCAIVLLLIAGSPSFGTLNGSIPASDFNALDGKVSESIVVSGSDNGVSFDLTFTFTANAGGTLTEGTRLGIDSPDNQGSQAANSINEGETLSMDVSANVTGLPTNHVLSTLDFGITRIDMVRAGPSNGTAGYLWASSAGLFNSPLTSKTGGQTIETFDGVGVFDIADATYLSTFTTNEDGDNNSSGFRWVTGGNNIFFNVTATTTAIPEPTTAILGLMGMAGMLARRRRAA